MLKKAFLSLLATLWNSALRCLYLSFSLLLFASLLFAAICKASLDSRFAILQDNQDNHDGVITHLEPDILECEVKWALGSITTNKASGGYGRPAKLFQVLKGDAVKVLHSICQQIWDNQQWSQDWKRSVFIPSPKKGNAKECSNYRTTSLISHPSKAMLKILRARLQQYMNQELPDVQAGFRKGRETRDQIPNICWIIEKITEFQKNICFIDYAKAFDCGDQTTLPAS